MSKELLLKAAEQIEKLAAENITLKADLAKHVEVKTASEKSDADRKAKLAELAKVASQSLLDAGLLSTAEKRDQFASTILDKPEVALDCLAKTAAFVRAPSAGKVVEETTTNTKTANDVWNQAVARGINRA